MQLELNIITPEEAFFSEKVDMVVLPGREGQFTVLPQHAPIISIIDPGELEYQQNSQTHHVAVGNGFVEVSENKVNVSTDLAINEDDINENEVEKALEKARQSLSEKVDAEEIAAVQASIQKSLAQLRIKRKNKMHVMG